MKKAHILIGGGGHALSVADALLSNEQLIAGYTSPEDQGSLVGEISYLGTDEYLADIDCHKVVLVNCIGSSGPTHNRKSLYQALTQQGFSFNVITHRRSSISPLVDQIANGTQILADAILNAGVSIGENTLINTRAVIEHGCIIGKHCHIATGAIVCGDCEIADEVHIGAGATVIQGIKIGVGAVIAAGAVVTQNVEPLTLVAGVPAVRKRHLDDTKLEKNRC